MIGDGFGRFCIKMHINTKCKDKKDHDHIQKLYIYGSLIGSKLGSSRANTMKGYKRRNNTKALCGPGLVFETKI